MSLLGRIARAVVDAPKEISNARGKCPQCGDPMGSGWPAYPGASYEVCGSCVIR